MGRWEYLVEDRGQDSWDEVSVGVWLNEKGAEGWELVHVSASLRTYFFKRRAAITCTTVRKPS